MNTGTYPTHKRPSDKFIRELFEKWHDEGSVCTRLHGDDPVDVKVILSYPHKKEELIALLSLYGPYHATKDLEKDVRHSVWIELEGKRTECRYTHLKITNQKRLEEAMARPWYNEWLVLAVLLHDAGEMVGPD